MKDFKHVVLTRFDYDNKEARDKRMEIFKKYTLPNMKKQTNKNFTWVFFSKEELDIPFKNKKFLSLTGYKKWKKILSMNHEYIIETRLDNDDFVKTNFIEKIQKNFKKDNFVLEFKGYRYDTRNEIFYEDILYGPMGTSPFVSLISKLNEGYYIFDYNHVNIWRAFPTTFKEDRLWVQIIHNSNKSMNQLDINIVSLQGNECPIPEWFK